MYKFKHLITIIIFFLLLTSIKVFPQEKTELMKFTIEESITTALKNSLELSSIDQDIVASDARLSQAETGKYPSFTADILYSRVHPLPKFNLGGGNEEGIEIGEPDQAQIGLNFNYSIYDGSLTSNLIDEKTLLKESVICTRDIIKQDLIFNVIEADYNVLKAQALFRVAEKNLETAQEQLKRASSFYDEGLVPMADVFNAKAQVANAELEIIKAKNNIEQTKSILKNIMYIPLDNPIEIIVNTPLCESLGVDLDYITQLAYENRNEIKKVQYLTLAAQSSIDVAKSQGRPNIYFNFDYIPASSTIFTPSNSIIATLGATIPIFDRGLTKYKVEEAEANLKRSEISIDQVKKNIALQVKQSYLDLIKAEEEVEKVEESLNAAEKNYTTASLRYEEGIAPFLEVTDSRMLFTRAEADKVQAHYNYFIAIAKIIKAVGLLPENGNFNSIKFTEN